MWDNLIGRQVRRSARNLLLWNAITLFAIIAFFAISSRYWYNFFFGPFPLTTEELVQLKDDRGLQFYVSVRGDACEDTGGREITIKKKHGVERSRRETAKRLALLVGDAVLIVNADMDASTSAVERRGVLKNFADVMNKPAAGPGLPGPPRRNPPQNPNPGRQLKVLPVVLDATVTRTKGFIGLAVLLPLGLINIVNILRAMSRLANPQGHPTAQALLKYGEPEEVAQKIEEEHESGETLQVGPVTFTRSWLVRPRTFGVDVIFLGDAAWAFKTITQHYTNGIPTGKTYAANLCDIHGARLTVVLKSEAQCDEFVMAVVERVPWVLFGYDQDLEQKWKQDKAKIYALVEQRRLELAAELRRQREAPDEAQPTDDKPLDAEPA